MNISVEERKRKANAEWKELIKWKNAESEKVIYQLKSEGAIMGLDGHKERFAYIRETEKKRLKEIAEKYDLSVPKLN